MVAGKPLDPPGQSGKAAWAGAATNDAVGEKYPTDAARRVPSSLRKTEETLRRTVGELGYAEIGVHRRVRPHHWLHP